MLFYYQTSIIAFVPELMEQMTYIHWFRVRLLFYKAPMRESPPYLKYSMQGTTAFVCGESFFHCISMQVIKGKIKEYWAFGKVPVFCEGRQCGKTNTTVNIFQADGIF